MKTYRNRLEMIADLTPGAVGAEIGVQRGDFSAEILSTPVKRLFLIDAWRPLPSANPKDPASLDAGGHAENYRHVRERFADDIASKRVVILKATSQLGADALWAKNLDFVYLDADHTYAGVWHDLCTWAPLVKTGGCLMGHDYVDNDQSRAMDFAVVSAVNNFIVMHDWRLDAVTSEEWPSFKLVRK